MRTASFSGLPAVRGGRPLFPEGLPLARPSVRDVDALVEELRDVLTGGVLTNGPRVRAL